MSANDHQVAGSHYSKQAIQVWDYVTANNIPYLEGNVIRYISRWREKGGIEDLRKAAHYVQKLIETEEARLASEPSPAFEAKVKAGAAVLFGTDLPKFVETAPDTPECTHDWDLFTRTYREANGMTACQQVSVCVRCFQTKPKGTP